MSNNTLGRVLRSGLIATGLVAAAAPMAAMAGGGLVLTSANLMLDKVVSVNGETGHQLVDPSVTHDKVIPGSHVVAVLHYRNDFAQAIERVPVVDTLDKALILSDVTGADYDVSVDGGKTFGKLAALAVSDGKGGSRAAQLADVNAVRWNIARIEPGQSGDLAFHAVVR